MERDEACSYSCRQYTASVTEDDVVITYFDLLEQRRDFLGFQHFALSLQYYKDHGRPLEMVQTAP